MQSKPPKPRKWIIFAASAVALVLCAFSCAMLRGKAPRSSALLTKLDAAAKPHFDEAERNVPKVVKELSSTGSFIKLCWLMTRDKLSNDHQTQKYLESVINRRIVTPCRRGAKVYGCDVDSKPFQEALRGISGCTAKGVAYAAGGLALEAVFIKSTLASLRSVLGAVIARLSASYGGGAACAVADGPLPIGDAIGLALAAGSTIWSISDIRYAQKRFPKELSAVLYQSIRECREACRMVVTTR